MGLFDKLFGGEAKPATPAPTTSTPAAPTPAPSAATPADVPQRRERAKRAAEAAPGAGRPPERDGENPMPQLVEVDPNQENAAVLLAINALVVSDNRETRDALYKALLESSLYLVSISSPDKIDESLTGTELVLTEGQQVQLATIQSPDKKTFLPAFTDLDRLKKTLPPGAQYVRMPVVHLCRLFAQGPGEGIVVNPGQAPSGVLTRAEANVLAMNAIPQIGPDGQVTAGEAQQQVRIAIGKPQTPPAASFVEAIQKAAQQQPSVREVHVFSAGVEGQPMRLMIGVLVDADQTPELMQPTFEAIGRSALEQRGETEQFDMMPLNDEIVEQLRPLEGLVYVRSVVV